MADQGFSKSDRLGKMVPEGLSSASLPLFLDLSQSHSSFSLPPSLFPILSLSQSLWLLLSLTPLFPIPPSLLLYLPPPSPSPVLLSRSASRPWY